LGKLASLGVIGGGGGGIFRAEVGVWDGRNVDPAVVELPRVSCNLWVVLAFVLCLLLMVVLDVISPRLDSDREEYDDSDRSSTHGRTSPAKSLCSCRG